jgi:hypothetical protein
MTVRSVCSVLLAFSLGACAFPIRTSYDADPEADFTRYGSYAWLSLEPAESPPGSRPGGYVSSLDEQRIVRAVDAELAARGYRKLAAVGGADLVVSYGIGVKEKTHVARYPSATGVRGDTNYGYGSWYSNTETRVETHAEGTISIHFYDRTTRQAVWVGWAQKRLEQGDDSEEVIAKAIAAVLADFPGRS